MTEPSALNLIVIDYTEGAGGNVFAQFINKHLGVLDVENYHYITNYLNANVVLYDNFDLDGFIDVCHHHGITNIAVPYHLHKDPTHVDILRKAGARIVAIRNGEHEVPIKMNFVKKIFLSQDIDQTEIVNRTAHLDKSVTDNLLELHKNGKLLGIDLFLVTKDLPITYENRKMAFQRMIDKKEVAPPSEDVIIEYEDFFVSKNLPEYHRLCNELGLTPNDEMYMWFLVSNQRHYLEMMLEAKDIDSIAEELIGNIL